MAPPATASAREAAPIRFGCPFWAFKDWCGSLYTDDARSTDFLEQYSRVFDAVEGNTTFYSVPSSETVDRWRESTPEHFRFCFKLPREITHDHHLHGVERETNAFFRAMDPLGQRLGPFMIQLPPSFGPAQLGQLERFLDALPQAHHYAVELRHPDFFSQQHDLCALVDRVLATRGCERAIMDTRPLRSGDGQHPDILAARHKKPNLPLHPERTGPEPLVRVVFHPEVATSEPFVEEWVERLHAWIGDGAAPYFFLHTPSNHETPARLRELRERLAKRVDIADLAPFPGESQESASGQLALFRA